MRTNIVLDEALVNQAFKCVSVSSKRELIDLALKELVINHSRKDISELRGKIKFADGYDYKKLRENI